MQNVSGAHNPGIKGCQVSLDQGSRLFTLATDKQLSVDFPYCSKNMVGKPGVETACPAHST